MSMHRPGRRRAAQAAAVGVLAAACAGVALAATITGTPRADRLRGTGGAETIKALGGNDVVTALGGDDKVDAGPGNDRVDLGPGNDTAVGGAGNDAILGGAGDDAMDGQAGNDTEGGGPGDDQVFGGAGNDVLRGGAGIDGMSGGPGNDKVFGEAGQDLLQGGPGSDKLDGGPDNDLIDAYDSPPQTDTITCGPGDQDLVMGDSLDVVAKDCEAFDRSDDPKRMIVLGIAGERWPFNTLTFPDGWVRPGGTFTCGPDGSQRNALFAFAMFRGITDTDEVLVTWRVDGDVFNSTSTTVTAPGTGVETFTTQFDDPNKALPNGLWEVELAVGGEILSKARFRRQCAA